MVFFDCMRNGGETLPHRLEERCLVDTHLLEQVDDHVTAVLDNGDHHDLRFDSLVLTRVGQVVCLGDRRPGALCESGEIELHMWL